MRRSRQLNVAQPLAHADGPSTLTLLRVIARVAAMIHKRETDDGWEFIIDDTGQTILLELDQVLRLEQHLAEIRKAATNPRSIRQKWLEIVRNGMELKGMPFHLQSNKALGLDDWYCCWGSGKSRQQPTIDAFIRKLAATDRPEAIEFFQRATKGRWTPT